MALLLLPSLLFIPVLLLSWVLVWDSWVLLLVLLCFCKRLRVVVASIDCWIIPIRLEMV